MARIEMDPAQLRVAQRALEEEGAQLDGLAGQFPSGGDCGAAGALMELALAIEAEVAALVSAESQMLGFAVGLCRADMTCTDAQQAVDIVTIGNSS